MGALFLTARAMGARLFFLPAGRRSPPLAYRHLSLYEAEDRYYRRMLRVGYAEIFSEALLLVESPTVFRTTAHAWAEPWLGRAMARLAFRPNVQTPDAP